jgi:hypothetical protein
MQSALTTAILVSTAGIIGALALGFIAHSTGEIARHISVAIFATLVMLLTHSMTMFYLIGKGKAIREAVQEAGIEGGYVAAISRARRPVFGQATLAMLLVMATAIIGGGVDTGVVPAGVHAVLGVSAALATLLTAKTEFAALAASTRITDEVNRRLAAE